MKLIIKPEDLFNNNICIGDKFKNNISGYSNFYPLYLTTSYFTLNNLTFEFTIYDYTIDVYFSKYKISFDNEKNKKFILDVKSIENYIMSKINVQNKIPDFKLSDQITSNTFKLSTHTVFKTDNHHTHLSKINNSISNINRKVDETYDCETEFIRNKSLTNKYESTKILLRISGIWDNDNYFGIIYKFVFL